MPVTARNLAAALLITAVLAPAHAQEVLLSRTGTSPAVATSGRGDFVIVWTDRGDILADTLPKGAREPRSPFVVSPASARLQVNPDVAVDGAGRFAVVWQDGLEFSGGDVRVFGEGFGASGGRQGPAVRLSPMEGDQQVSPQVAMLEDGSFVAAWVEDRLPHGAIKAARFSADGSPLGPEMEMKAGGDSSNRAKVASFPGGFAVGWSEFTECSGGRPPGFVSDIARFDAEGRRTGRIYYVGTSRCSSPDATVLLDLVGSRAGALALFVSDHEFIQRFSPSGAPVGGRTPLPVHPCDESHCTGAETVSMDNAGRFAVIWEVIDSGSFSLAAQLFNPRGKPLTGLVPVSELPAGSLIEPVAAALADDGTLAVVWRREQSGDPQRNGLYLRKLRLP
jgi:hypothetical protein